MYCCAQRCPWVPTIWIKFCKVPWLYPTVPPCPGTFQARSCLRTFAPTALSSWDTLCPLDLLVVHPFSAFMSQLRCLWSWAFLSLQISVSAVFALSSGLPSRFPRHCCQSMLFVSVLLSSSYNVNTLEAAAGLPCAQKGRILHSGVHLLEGSFPQHHTCPRGMRVEGRGPPCGPLRTAHTCYRPVGRLWATVHNSLTTWGGWLWCPLSLTPPH